MKMISDLYENSRIKKLADERDHMQKILFTKWINAQLGWDFVIDGCLHSDGRKPLSQPQPYSQKASKLWGLREMLCVHDLFDDLRDGRVLLRLLGLLSGKFLPEPHQIHMRIHRLENVSKALRFLCAHGAHMENLGAQDIVDGNPRLTLGLIWTIILHFQVRTITVKESDETGEVRHARDALLLWCQLKTAGYSQVHVTDFTTSWRDGLAFCALLHRHWPELIDFEKMLLLDSKPWERIEIAFKQASDNLGIPQLIEPADLFEDYWSDERCILTVVVTWYQFLTNSQYAQVYTSRLNHVISQCLEISQLAQQYMCKLRRWVQWAEATKQLIGSKEQNLYLQISKCPDPECLIREQLKAITEWSQGEKSDRMLERSELEFLLHTIQIRQLAAGHNRLEPPEGLRPVDVDRRWEEVTTAERAFCLTHLNALNKQANLQHAGRRFDRKLSIFAAWLAENEQLLKVTEIADAASFRSEMSIILDAFSQITSTSESQISHTANVPPKLHRITTARRKHAAWLADAEAYVDIRSQRLQCVLNELLIDAVDATDTAERMSKWASLRARWAELQDRFERRTCGLKAIEDWFYCLVDVHDLLDRLCFRITELNTCDSEKTVQIEVTLNRIRDELSQLDGWSKLVEATCLGQANYGQKVTDNDDSKCYPVLWDLCKFASDYVERVRKIHLTMSHNLDGLNRWNDQKRQAYELLNEVTEELEWVKASD